MKRASILFLLMIISLGLYACGNENGSSVSEDSMTVAEEIAGGVSEDVVPIEATQAIGLDIRIPNGFRAAKGNTDNNETFVSENENDNSYICYIRQEKDERTDYKLLTEEDYKKAIEDQLETEITISSLEQTEYQNYEETILNLTYSRNNVKYEVKECIFITEKYLFTVVYAMDENAYWQQEFEESRKSITLENTISLMEKEEE